MEDAKNERAQLGRSLRRVVLLGFAYALAGNGVLYASYYNSGIIDSGYLVCALLAVAFAVPVVLLFRNRHWYFPAFIFLFWIPFSVLIGYLLSLALPMTMDSYEFGLLLVYYLILNVIAIVVGLALGMIVNALWLLGSRLKAGK
ncbi:hypothetical protein [Paenibacillus arenilitoris]|uniref:Uncharacterized protein n=1 Tax=Paenibacillus arenilitoris TaxID=2772299 RepID=A0A927CHQ3_9BACL|nr:hypothetical protein [Paenibacillus arenilitoris]MBD2868303.1 hypothetical protein [Paenibacillus arenilitoris]